MSEDRNFLIFNTLNRRYYAARFAGYARNRDEAFRYTYEEATTIEQMDNNRDDPHIRIEPYLPEFETIPV